jgi:D-arginine dehydrogenase
MTDFDIAIIGAGIAGAGIAAALAAQRHVLLIEAESHPGYHSTGRSAAFWSETYGGPGVQPLTSASGAFLQSPPAEFADSPLLAPRGALHLGAGADRMRAEAMLAEFTRSGVALERLDDDEIAQHVSGLLPGWSEALWEPDCCDIDVAALHGGYLKVARKAGVSLACNKRLSAARFANGQWEIDAGGNLWTAQILINAAGAWADQVALAAGIKPLGITPYRRTIMQLVVEPPASPSLPLVVGLDGSFYFKPEPGGRLWLSPHDEIACEPCDAAPEELDVAVAIDRFHQVVDWKITRLERKWAGLRSFAPDRLPVIGRDPANPQFFWAAGQGGFGIQTAPAISELAAALVLDKPLDLPGVDPMRYAVERLR